MISLSWDLKDGCLREGQKKYASAFQKIGRISLVRSIQCWQGSSIRSVSPMTDRHSTYVARDTGNTTQTSLSLKRNSHGSAILAEIQKRKK